MTTYDLSPLYQTTVGFDRFQDILDKVFAQDVVSTGYPPYNIEKTSDESYVISIAAAGFTSKELEIEVRENKLLVTGKKSSDDAKRVFLHKGIGQRSFQRKFQLADHVKVVSADFSDGMLNISLEREIPEAYKPRKIAISNGHGNGSTIVNEKAVEIEG